MISDKIYVIKYDHSFQSYLYCVVMKNTLQLFSTFESLASRWRRGWSRLLSLVVNNQQSDLISIAHFVQRIQY